MRVEGILSLFACLSLVTAARPATTSPATSSPTTSSPATSSPATTSSPSVTESPTSVTTSGTGTSSPTSAPATNTSATGVVPTTSAATATLPTGSLSPTVLPTPTLVPAPLGGVGLNETPVFQPLSDYDVQSIQLDLHQSLLELNLLQFGLTQFNTSDFTQANLTEEDVFLLQYMVEQDAAHVQLVQGILSPNITQPCNYTFPVFADVRGFLDFAQKITRIGESGTAGWINHLDSQASASYILSALLVEARQQMALRQMEGLFPMPYYFVPSITQSMHWSLIAPFIATCPPENPTVNWTVFPPLTILNDPFWPDLPLDNTSGPSISANRSSVSFPGRELNLSWVAPGQPIGSNSSFNTTSNASTPQFVAWISEVNITYTSLNNVTGTNGTAIQPEALVFSNLSAPLTNLSAPVGNLSLPLNLSAPLFNETVFIALTDAAIYVTPYNLSQLEPHIFAGPAIYQAG
ncbi:hypothetical protein EWM64_g8632 [Hericium alpestre]|uniref:Protein rds1 n=1 Tax=Hericium alpestre TaxID=135208 RepID=A0A4Y9ZNG1_9AGAM|nr:hypothetical protein EWM64_g8632 [Hericium alpestre]